MTKSCAIYTRKSSEEGLEQEFNSLDAQRESCLAYIKSQKSEGWTPVKDHYDDGGYSGGNMERPGLKKLMEDIKSGKVHIVVVYKIDRLTRSLMDFAKLVEVFDQHQVTFVSVTQSFNTTTSMGRLTLNVLLSFAQFEREVTGERIRDKIAASKKKGMWMGGSVPLGYDAKEKKLIINNEEAEIVKKIYKSYLELGCVRLLRGRLDNQNISSKARIRKDGVQLPGTSFSRGGLYKLLSNPIYIGQIKHKNECHQGQHDPIIDKEIWDQVQQKLVENAVNKTRFSKSETSLFAGKLFDESGEALISSHAVKKGRRYRYYISKHLNTGVVYKNKTGWRLPAKEIEAVVAQSVRNILNDHAATSDGLREANIDAHHIPAILDSANKISNQPNSLPGLVKKVELRKDGIRTTLSLATLVPQGSPIFITQDIPMQMKRRGIEMRLIINGERKGKVDPSLVKAIARARNWFDDISSRKATVQEIASSNNINERYISALLPLAFLAPNIIEKIVSGKHPEDLTMETLIKRINLPVNWEAQRKVLGLGIN